MIRGSKQVLDLLLSGETVPMTGFPGRSPPFGPIFPTALTANTVFSDTVNFLCRRKDPSPIPR